MYCSPESTKYGMKMHCSERTWTIPDETRGALIGCMVYLEQQQPTMDHAMQFANDLTRVLNPVCSTTGTRDPVTSALHIILGKKMSLDIAQVVRWKTSPSSTEVPSVRYAASFAGYGNLFLNSATRQIYAAQLSADVAVSRIHSQDSRWLEYKGRFLSVGAAIISCRNERAPKGLVAEAHLADGFLHLILIKDCPHPLYLW
ncbi:hypothetical protein BHE74_00013544 [Ensete ventricosum]|nr:hypothetical protein GW17_00041383 [Ensete ventricosum]RWW78239.1 hypothetical protein BHE74_00013544 [Ensete ventricosum]